MLYACTCRLWCFVFINFVRPGRWRAKRKSAGRFQERVHVESSSRGCSRPAAWGLAPDVLSCCSRIISRQRGNLGFQASLEQAFERVLLRFRNKLQDVKAGCGTLSMKKLLIHNHDADQLIPEVEQFLDLTREVLNSFPQVLLQKCPNGELTLYWVCLDLATRLIKADHQVKHLCF
uniref:Uncharacterized protein n=1 Tax=Hyaloperonospora arabidopsidis (strain Emoy2) TaxID=559515 RepID=M4BD71_HYAAE